MRTGFCFLIVFLSLKSFGQASVSGVINLPDNWSRKIYLSVVYDYREMTVINKEHIIGVAEVDSSNSFSFQSNRFTNKELIYRVHVAPESDEEEVFLADFSEEGFGYNFFVFQAKLGDQVHLFAENPFKIFEKVTSKNEGVETWSVLNEKKLQYQSATYDLGNDEVIHLLEPFHDDLIKYCENKSVVSKIIACSFMIEEGVDLSKQYLSIFSKNRKFYTDLAIRLDVDYPFYKERFDKELALIDLQLDGDELEQLRNENRWLYAAVIGLVFVFIGWFFMTKIRKKQKVELTKQEERIKGLILDGKSNKEIAEELFISVSTVKTHINTLYKKCGVSSRKELQVFK